MLKVGILLNSSLYTLTLIFCFLSANSQKSESRVYSDSFYQLPGEKMAITSLNDGGVVYLTYQGFWHFASFSNDTFFIKNFYASLDLKLPSYKWGEESGFLILYKTNDEGEIIWAKNIGNYITGRVSQRMTIKEISNNNLLVCYLGNIIKLNSSGEKLWQINLRKDSVPEVRKSKLLSLTPISDINECKDGSLIALLDASFSLLKINPNGEIQWIRSTLFEDVNALLYDDVTDKYKNVCTNKATRKTENGTESGLDSTYYRISNYGHGGGVDIRTFAVYETHDKGYIALGKNSYRCRNMITKIEKGQKEYKNYYYNGVGYCNEYEILNPEVVYEVCNLIYPGFYSEQKEGCKSFDGIVLIKTDSLGNVEWERQMGDKGFADHLTYADLLKLEDNNFLIRIRTCDSIRYEYNNFQKRRVPIYGDAHSKVFIYNEDGDLVEDNSIWPFKLDPWWIDTSSEGGYFAGSQNNVYKLNKNLEIEWHCGYGGWASDLGYHSPTKDDGVLCIDRKIIYKIDKHGNLINDSIRIQPSVNGDTLRLIREMKSNKDIACRIEIKALTQYNTENQEFAVDDKDLIYRRYELANVLFPYRKLVNQRNYEKSEKYFAIPVFPGEQTVTDSIESSISPEVFSFYPKSIKSIWSKDQWLDLLNDIKYHKNFIYCINDLDNLNGLKINSKKRINHINTVFNGGKVLIVLNLPQGKYIYKVYSNNNNIEFESSQLLYKGEFEIKN
ncbi:MAG: hypothetical protein A2W91_19635 [Bacteroidetes bacterium GWF2_38_335]|nr:MAG: hypothetical protein A2W91_19635 [Bacteroidetes bacterium GWF2_38_335]OFY79968.1 MAG: hypothetical protein A2281_11035 [Bacteroidetes bacterium RIFOXYA12_FULL_38_20]HBS86428.1 hypothetical protein [Bacteroidales bacterium]